MMKCGNCGQDTSSAATVKACYAGQRERCGWLVEGPMTEDGERPIEECGAHVTSSDRGWECEAGHDYVSMEARHAERWDYAHDWREAEVLAAAGIDSVSMRGDAHVYGVLV